MKSNESDEEERAWRKALQKLGAVAVRRQLQQSIDSDDNTTSTHKQAGSSKPPRRFVDAWYREAQHTAQRAKNIRAKVFVVVLLAAIATGILFLTAH